MRISIMNLNFAQRVAIIVAVAVTFPVSAPVVTALIIQRKLKKKRKLKKIKNGPIAVLRDKLWGGFGQATSAEILICLSEGRFKPKDRAELCYEHGRRQIDPCDWMQEPDLLNKLVTLNSREIHWTQPASLCVEVEH